MKEEGLSSVTPEDELLLVCARLELKPPDRQRLEHLLGNGLDWDALVTKAVRQGIPTLVYHHLRGDHLSLIAPQARTSLEQIYHAASLVAMRQRFEAGRLLDVVHRADISVIALKGLALNATVYPDPTLRLCGDVDLLVHPQDIEVVETALHELGYVPEQIPRPEDWRPDMRHHLVPYRLPGREVLVEIHWDLARPRAGFNVDVDELWSRAGTVQFETRALGVLAPVDQLLHLCLHTSARSRFRTGLRHLVDIGEVTRRFESQIEWDEVIARAEQWRVLRHAYLTLQLAKDLLGAPVPKAALQKLRPERFDRRILSFAKARLLAPGLPGSSDQIPKGLAVFLVGSPAGGRLRAVWKGTFLPRDRMARFYGLPPGSLEVYTYYLRRPLQLVGRHLSFLASSAVGGRQSMEALRSKRQDLALDWWLTSSP